MVQQKQRGARKRAPLTRPQFGPVSTVNTAPVAIGNSIRGTKAQVINTPGGAKVIGRDFAFSVFSTAASITNWELAGGMPLTPCVLPSSVLRNYCQMFSYFKVNKMMVHYITSSPTSQAGDIMFYYERNRKSPFPDYSNSSFLPFILSDSNTVIGPQWTNHTLVIDPVQEWKTTAFGTNSDFNEDALGSVFLFSKTNSANSPGYVLIDYDISFKEMAVNPRAGVLPVSRGQCNPTCLSIIGSVVVAGTTTLTFAQSGNQVSGLASGMPTGALTGDIYKFVVSAAASTGLNTWSNCTLANLLVVNYSKDVAVTIDDGFTCYIRVFDTTAGGGDVPQYNIYPNIEGALTNSAPYLAGVTATITAYLTGTVQLVTSVANSFTQASY